MKPYIIALICLGVVVSGFLFGRYCKTEAEKHTIRLLDSVSGLMKYQCEIRGGKFDYQSNNLYFALPDGKPVYDYEKPPTCYKKHQYYYWDFKNDIYQRTELISTTTVTGLSL